MKKYINIIIAVITGVALLSAVYWWGGDSKLLHGWNVREAETNVINKSTSETSSADREKAIPHGKTEKETQPPQNTVPTAKPESNKTASATAIPVLEQTVKPTEKTTVKPVIDETSEQTEIISGEKVESVVFSTPEEYTKDDGQNRPEAVNSEKNTVTNKKLSCTLSVRCDTISDNMDLIPSEKVSLVPDDGVILKETEVVFYEGESVFNVLLREMKRNKIHMEFVKTPVYDSAYIEGINNIYEFDCGELSGWMYKVNGWFPNYGCSRYILKDGDSVEWVYTCNLGKDVGGDYASQNTYVSD